MPSADTNPQNSVTELKPPGRIDRLSKVKAASAEGYSNLLQNGIQQVQQSVTAVAASASPRRRPISEPPAFHIDYIGSDANGNAQGHQGDQIVDTTQFSVPGGDDNNNNIRPRAISSVESPSLTKLERQNNLRLQRGQRISRSSDSPSTALPNGSASNFLEFIDHAENESASSSPKSTHSKNGNLSDLRNDDAFTNTDSSDSEKEPALPVKCPVDHSAQGKEMINAMFTCHVDELFTMLFTKSKFYMEFHESRKSYNVAPTDWECSTEDRGKKVRKISMMLTLNNPLARNSKFTDLQTILPASRPGYLYSIETEGTNSGIPYADSFSVVSHFCLSHISARQSSLVVISQVKFLKSVFGVKGFIEKNSLAGLVEFYSHLERALKEECTKRENQSSSREASPALAQTTDPLENSSILRRRQQQSSDRPVLRKKRPAPPVPAVNLSSTSLVNNSNGDHFTRTQYWICMTVLLFALAIVVFNVIFYLKLDQLGSAISNSSSRLSHTSGGFGHSTEQFLEAYKNQEIVHKAETEKWNEAIESAIRVLKRTELNLENLRLLVNKQSHSHEELN